MPKRSSILAISILLYSSIACQSKTTDNTDDVDEVNSSIESEVGKDVEPIEITNDSKASTLDSAAILYEIEKLSIIEQLAVFNAYKQTYDFELYASLLKHKKQEKRFQELSTELTNVTGYFNLVEFIKVDPKNGYIQYAQAESMQTIVYWNKSDGTKLVAKEIMGCGPVCESSILFMIYKNGTTTILEEIDYRGLRKYEDGEFKKYSSNFINEKSQIIPQARDLPYKLIPSYDETNLDPIEFSFVLPQKGKNIQFCLEDDCVEMVWDDGVFLLENE